MRRPKWKTLRWRIPSSIRQERFEQFLARKDLDGILGPDFFKSVESKKQQHEDRLFKILAWQIPIFLFLALSLINVEAPVGIFGLTAKSSGQIREILLCISTFLGFLSWTSSVPLSYLNEMLQAAARKQSKGDGDLKEFLEIRYGVSLMMAIRSYDSKLSLSLPQLISASVATLAFIVVVLILLTIVVAVQAVNLFEVYAHPNFSPQASLLVIVFVLCGDLFFVLVWFMRKSLQPYSTYADFEKLTAIKSRDQEKYDAILRKMVLDHKQKSPLGRLFGRPKLPRLD